MQHSFLKWSGGKFNALPHIMAHIPTEGELLIEPFMGGCTVALNLEYKNMILRDMNPDLVTLCNWVSRNPKVVISQAKELFVPQNNTAEMYYLLRERYNIETDPKKRALLFLYLNRHSYNGLVRYSRKGRFNVPFGSYAKINLPIEAMHKFSSKLKHAKFIHGPFQGVRLGKVSPVIYNDPPYLPVSGTASFSDYTARGFCKEDHLDLDKHCSRWAKKGASVWLSNHDVPTLEDCYSGALERVSFEVRRSISSKGSERTPAKEVLLQY